jgi:hypothetical protein
MLREHNLVLVTGAVCLLLGSLTNRSHVRYMELTAVFFLIVCNYAQILEAAQKYIFQPRIQVLQPGRRDAAVFGRSLGSIGLSVGFLLGISCGLLLYVAINRH